MKNTVKFGLLTLAVITLSVLASCKKKDYSGLPIVGHWGCEQYVSCRTSDDGTERWDTLLYEVKPNNCEYELYFNKDGSGKLVLNNSPAVLKSFPCTYEYDVKAQQITIRSSEWLNFLYSSFTHGRTEAYFDVEVMTDTLFVASWINEFSEDKPFFEKFFVKRIE